jgi:hypothetical protein
MVVKVICRITGRDLMICPFEIRTVGKNTKAGTFNKNDLLKNSPG